MEFFLKVIPALGEHVTGLDKFQWECYPNALSLDAYTGYGSVTVIFNFKNFTVYEITSISENMYAHAPKFFRWVNPLFLEKLKQEYLDRDLTFENHINGLPCVEIESAEDALGKAQALLAGEEVKELVEVVFNIDDATLITLSLAAHRDNVTLNEYIVNLLRVASEEYLDG